MINDTFLSGELVRATRSEKRIQQHDWLVKEQLEAFIPTCSEFSLPRGQIRLVGNGLKHGTHVAYLIPCVIYLPKSADFNVYKSRSTLKYQLQLYVQSSKVSYYNVFLLKWEKLVVDYFSITYC